MASAQPVSDYVICGVCMEEYNSTDHIPKILPCQHTFCLSCLLSLERSSLSLSIECPVCRSQQPGSPQDFTTNRALMDIAEKLHEQASPTLSCSTHADMESVLVCVDCLTGLCARCMKKLSGNPHKDHQLEELDDGKTVLREKLENQIREQQSVLKKKMESAYSVTQITKAEADITEMFTQLLNIITSWHKDHLSKMREFKEEAENLEQELIAQEGTLQSLLNLDPNISTLIAKLQEGDTLMPTISDGPPTETDYNFGKGCEAMLINITSVIRDRSFIQSKLLQKRLSQTQPNTENTQPVSHQDTDARLFQEQAQLTSDDTQPVNEPVTDSSLFQQQSKLNPDDAKPVTKLEDKSDKRKIVRAKRKTSNQQLSKQDTSSSRHHTENQDLSTRMTSILNQSSLKNLYIVVAQVLKLDINTEERLQIVADHVVEKAITSELYLTGLYVNIASRITVKVPSASDPNELVSFQHMLMNQCQSEFERCFNPDRDVAGGQAERHIGQKLLHGKERTLGLISFIGALFMTDLMTSKIMCDCIIRLLKLNNDESLEFLCILLTRVGKHLDTPESKELMDQHFRSLESIMEDEGVPHWVRLMIEDLIRLRYNKWNKLQ